MIQTVHKKNSSGYPSYNMTELVFIVATCTFQCVIWLGHVAHVWIEAELEDAGQLAAGCVLVPDSVLIVD